MAFGVHLPLVDSGGNPFTPGPLITCAELSRDLGFKTLAASDRRSGERLIACLD